MSDSTWPSMGPARSAMDLTCGRLMTDGHCGKPATQHFAWGVGPLGAENGLCCDEHTSEAHERGWGEDNHPVTHVCTMPDTVWVGSLAEPPGYCAWVQGDGERVRGEYVWTFDIKAWEAAP